MLADHPGLKVLCPTDKSPDLSSVAVYFPSITQTLRQDPPFSVIAVTHNLTPMLENQRKTLILYVGRITTKHAEFCSLKEIT